LRVLPLRQRDSILTLRELQWDEPDAPAKNKKGRLLHLPFSRKQSRR
jgi:hypothetical protein